MFGKNQGLDLDPQSGSSVYQLDGEVHVVTGKRGYRFRSPDFIPDAGPPFTLVDRPEELVVEQTPLGAYAFSRRHLWFRPVGQGEWKPLYLGSQLAAGYSRLRYNHDNVLRLATWSGLLQFNPGEEAPPQTPLLLGFELVTAESPDGQELRRLPVVSQRQPVEIPSGYRLHFRYGMVSMDSGAGIPLPPATAAACPIPGAPGPTATCTCARSPPAITCWKCRRARAAAASPRRPATATRSCRAGTNAGGCAGSACSPCSACVGLLVQEFVRRRTQRYVEANRKLEARIGERTHELEEVNRKLAELATEDALTGVSNRRALENGLQREWYRCLDQRRPLSVLMIDVDHFKNYNDAHGHLEGDVLLRSIAQKLASLHDPKRELLARYGGEEFALLLPGVHQDERSAARRDHPPGDARAHRRNHHQRRRRRLRAEHAGRFDEPAAARRCGALPRQARRPQSRRGRRRGSLRRDARPPG